MAEQIRAIFREYDPRMRSHSLDEAYLNVTEELVKRLDESATATADANSAGAPSTATDPTVSPTAPGADHGGPTSRAPTQQEQRRRDNEELTRRSMDARSMDVEARDAGYTSEEGEEDVRAEAGAGAGRQRMARGEFRARMFEAARALAEEIRGRIRETTKITASVGIGPNFMLAKVLRMLLWCIQSRVQPVQ